MKYQKPKMESMQFDLNDIIVTSFGDGNGEAGTDGNTPGIKPGVDGDWA